MNAKEIKLINALKKTSTVKEGRFSTGNDGVNYRYDHYYFNYPSAHNWLVNLFNEIAGRKSQINIENFMIAYERPNFKNQNNGVFRMTELIENI